MTQEDLIAALDVNSAQMRELADKVKSAQVEMTSRTRRGISKN